MSSLAYLKEQNEDWFKELQQEMKASQNQNQSQHQHQNQSLSQANLMNDFGLDITSWTNNNIKKQQSIQKKKRDSNEQDIEKYYQKKNTKKKSQLDQIVMHNHLVYSSALIKINQSGKYKKNTQQKSFKLLKEQKIQVQQAQPEFAYFQTQNGPSSTLVFIQSKNLLNQNKISLKEISQKNIVLSIICIILFILVEIFSNDINFLIFSVQISGILLCMICKFLNKIFEPHQDIINSTSTSNDKTKINLNLAHEKNVLCFKKRILFYKVFICGIGLTFIIILFDIVLKQFKTEQIQKIRIFLIICMGYLNLNLIKQAKKVLFLEQQIYIDYLKNYNIFQQMREQIDQFDFQ